MANIKLEHKLKTSLKDQSDLKNLHLNVWRFILSIFLVGLTTWFMSITLAKIVLLANDYLFSLITNKVNFLNISIFVVVLLGVSIIRSLLYQNSVFKDSFGDGSSNAIHHFYDTYDTGASSDKIIKAAYAHPTFLRAIRRFFITFLTLGAGGSGGLEGPIIPLGESLGTAVSKIFQITNVTVLRILQMCGICAGVTALLHTPLTGAFFASELVFGGRFVYRILIFSLFASLIVFSLSNHFLDLDPLIIVNTHEITFSLKEYLYIIIVSLFVCVPSGLALILIFDFLTKVYSYFPKFYHAPLGALVCIFVSLTLFYSLQIPVSYVLGVGEEIISDLFLQTNPILHNSWQLLLLVVLCKILLTGCTIKSGGSAGLLIPAMIVGALASSAFYEFLITYQILQNDHVLHSIFLISGICSSLICVIDLPIAVIMLSCELFGVSYLPVTICAVIVSRTFSETIKQKFIH